MRSSRRVPVVQVVFALFLCVIGPAAAAAANGAGSRIAGGGNNQFWRTHEGELLLGPPISGQLHELNGDGSGRVYLVQYCLNGRLEYHPETKDVRYQVQLGRVGYEYLHLQGFI